MLSNIYSKLRGDVSGVKNEDSAQGFVRSTTKYWVRTTDISAVKHHILQHLPVFQYNEGSVRCPPVPLKTWFPTWHPESSTASCSVSLSFSAMRAQCFELLTLQNLLSSV